jgi:mRNA interferase MazF
MKRGDLVTVVVAGDYGKPRPAVVIQSDHLDQGDSVLVTLLTSSMADASYYRLSLEPDEENGLRAPSQIMVDKILAVPRAKCGAVIGRLDNKSLTTFDQLLLVMVGLAD